MTHPGPEYPAPAQPGVPTDAQQAQPAEKKGGAKKWASLAGSAVVLAGGAAYTLTGGFGIGDPKVGDCVHMKSETDFEAVSCDDDTADAKVIGIEDEKRTESDFNDAPVICTDFPDAEGALWYQNGMITEKGTVYCVVSQ
jgi:hypothetical protein